MTLLEIRGAAALGKGHAGVKRADDAGVRLLVSSSALMEVPRSGTRITRCVRAIYSIGTASVVGAVPLGAAA